MHVHMPEERDHLAALLQHKKQMQEKYYRVLNKVKETDVGRRAVKKLVSNSFLFRIVKILRHRTKHLTRGQRWKLKS